MRSTSTTFINSINTNYPVPGVDNDTQGFRDNYSNIKNSLATLAGEVSSLKLNFPNADSTTDYSYSGKLFRPVFTAYGVQAQTSTPQSNDIVIDFLGGNYQSITLTSDSAVSIKNWPIENILGKVRLNFKTSGQSAIDVSILNYGNTVVKPNSLSFPYVISTGTTESNVIFDVWSYDSGSTIYVDRIFDNSEIISPTVAAAELVTNPAQPAITSVGELSSLNVNGAEFSVHNNILTISGVENINIASTVTTNARLVDLTDAPEYYGAGNRGVVVDDASRVLVGSTFKFYSTETVLHTVYAVDTTNNIIYTADEWFPGSLTPHITLSPSGGSLIYFNGGVSLSSTFYGPSVPTDLKGNINNKRGEIVANADGVYICYTDYTDGIDNVWTYAPSKTTQNRVKLQSATTNTNEGYVEYNLSISNSFFHSDVLTGNITPLVSNLPTEPAQIDLKITVNNGNETYLVCPDNILLGNTTTNYSKNVYWKQVSTTGTNTTLASVATIPPMPNTKSVYRFTIVGTGGTVESSSWTILGERDDYV